MKKEKITSFLSGVVSCTLVLGLATTALAATREHVLWPGQCQAEQ